MSSTEEGHAALKGQSTPMRQTSSERLDIPSTSPHRILPLSAEAISQIHSSKHITSLQTVVLALLENSLDARSSEVDIAVDWTRGGCSVNDNGFGIPRTEFGENGGLGRMYCTSKRAPVATTSNNSSATFHGSNGIFLAELAAMSLLSIISMQTGDHDSSILALHQGKVIKRNMMPPDDPNLPTTYHLHGTNVSVKDLFGNMPVRVKQRALIGENGHDKDWHELKRGVVALLLAWPLPCAVKLRDRSGQHKAVNIVGHHPKVGSALTEKSLNQLAGKLAKFDLRDNMPMLFHVGFAPRESISRWVPLCASTSAFTLRGMICLDPAPTKQCQFLALGISPCGNGSGNDELHDAVNKVFANSSFGVVEERPDNVGTARDQERDDGYTAKQLQPQKGVDRYPMYCMQLAFRSSGQSARSNVDNIHDATLRSLVDILEASVIAWLDKHGFRPRTRRRRRNEEQQSSAIASTSAVRPSVDLTTRPVSHHSAIGNTGVPNQPGSLREDGRDGRPSSKRRKIVDLSITGESATRRSKSLQEREADPSLQSRIRTGRMDCRPQSVHGPVFSVSKTASEDGNVKVQRPRTVDSSCTDHVQIASRGPGSEVLQSNTTRKSDPKTVNASNRYTTSTFRPSKTDHSDAAATTNDMPISKTALTSDDFDGLDDADILQAEENSGLGVATGPIVSGVGDPSEDGIVIWRDPVSKQSYRVNSRTGVVLPAVLATGNLASGTTSHGTRRQPAAIDTALSSAGKPLSLARRAAAAAKDEALNVSTRNEKWLPGFLKEWNNPVFVARKEERIPVASIDGPSLLEGGSQVKCCARGAAGLHDSVQSSVHAASTKLSKAAFTQAEVLAQVDRKFILCKMAASAPDTDIIATSSLLVLIDQHAASERIILEGLFNSLFTTSHSTNGPTFTIKTINLPTGTSKQASLRYVITHQEHTLFTKYEPHFLLFGINYTSHPTQPLSHNNTGFHATRSAKLEYRLTVTDLPTVIAERCARLPTICIDLLRAELWALHDGTRSAVPRLPEFQVGEPAEPYWVKVLPLLPVKFLAMLQSRACRSAVMFNDPLSMQQCRDLVKDLGRCVFPFGCAHGRVSMVPLVDLGGHDADEVGEGGGIGRIERDLRWTGKPKEDQEGDQTDDGDVRERERTGDVGVLRAWMKSKKDV